MRHKWADSIGDHKTFAIFRNEHRHIDACSSQMGSCQRGQRGPRDIRHIRGVQGAFSETCRTSRLLRESTKEAHKTFVANELFPWGTTRHSSQSEVHKVLSRDIPHWWAPPRWHNGGHEQVVTIKGVQDSFAGHSSQVGSSQKSQRGTKRHPSHMS